MAAEKANKQYPIRHYVKMMFLISFIVLVLDFVISLATISIVKQQSTRYLQDTADLYINRINHDFAYISHYMGWTLANDESVATMTGYPLNSWEFFKAGERLHKRFTELQKNYGQEYNFFLYLKNQDYFLNYAPISIPYGDYQDLKEQITSDLLSSNVQDNEIYERFYSKWTPVMVRGKYYMISIAPYQDSYMIALISADNLISPLRQINLGEDGLASFVAEDGTSLTSPILNNGTRLTPEEAQASQSPPSFLNLIQTRTTVDGEFTNATFHVKLVIQFGTFEKIVIAQLLILLLALIIAGNLAFILMYFRRKVLTPIKRFSYNLSFWTEDGETIDMESSKIIELEKANTQFQHLVGQIKKFKIDLYERELEKQRIQLDYMKLQINPHFFLNCLTSIYSMAQMQMYEEIENMAMSTSKYFRYIFQNGENFVRLEDEIDHVRTYLDIQRHRYQNALSFRIERDTVEDTGESENEGKDADQGKRGNDTGAQTDAGLIPPLVLQTFIENAVKYGVSRTREAQIILKLQRKASDPPVKEQENPASAPPRNLIQIADNGPGFPPDVLEALRQGRPLDQSKGTHIGIMNTLQRLESLYRQQASVTFSNLATGGACVTIDLPVYPPE
ncbi:histidine kinase [Paenibacillus yonginensis]|uniref:Histidine kinase n=1 Tax=Paenibacillus yonginensis TaxID=1462996 RepID=A0A1B1N2R7_9BACL|nr:histidine kinase [Paenibacillus yonginensis]ANS75717.1 histidine kinase [Paenibacillus yonginensis]